jgi:16S rRNA C967 or C1407 C5-methylase (RsmB/RsmF family)
MDIVLIDAPCSGTGTLRRNPDMKWRLTPDSIDALIQQQRDIIASALKYLKPSGKLIYVTCSLLFKENQEQVDYFLKQHSLILNAPPFQTFPQKGGMDGFFGASFSFSSRGI